MNLSKFATTENLHATVLDFFKNDLKINIKPFDSKPIGVADFFKDDNKTNTKAAQNINKLFVIGLIDNATIENKETEIQNINDATTIKTDYAGLIICAIELKQATTRGQLAELTRLINRSFPHLPVTVIFRYDNKITLANAERTKFDQVWREGEKVGKVSMLKDIAIVKPHAAHERILLELSKHNAKSFDELYKHWQKKLNTKELNDAFYFELFNWYLWAKDNATFPNDTNEENDKHLSESLIRFISRILFVWFMKEKNLIDNQIFDAKKLKNILNNFDEKSKNNIFYKAILQNLFFATLNVPIDDRKWIDGKKRNKAQIGDPLIYRYEKEFFDSEDVINNIFMKIPFLNGGLFDCLDDRKNDIFIDGFTKNEKKQPKLPNYLFFGEQKAIDLSHHFADDANEKKKWKNQTVTGIIDLLNNYKFTIEENTPTEIDVALDPELLGKVFENLLASFNPETKGTARKQTGSFYTPREIVNYMVNESLKQHLITHLPNNTNDIEKLFIDQTDHFDQPLKKKIIEKLFDCKILDPACGSGAYPMGVLHKMVELMTILDPKNEHLKQIMKEKVIGEKIEELDKDKKSIQGLNDNQVRQKALEAVEGRLQNLEKIFNNEFLFNDYARKLYIIENCIYGVDIQSIAIQISKLRFFISLLVEQTKNNDLDNMGIEPLPNMDFKLVAANTLIAPPQEDKGIGMFENQNEFFENFEQLAHDYFTLHTPESKKAKKDEIKLLINQKVAEKKKLIASVSNNKNLEQSVALWESYHNIFKDKAVGFFDTPYFFPKVKDGFDVVIGNPPYVQSKFMEISLKNYLVNKYLTCERQFDLFNAFIEVSINVLLKNNGVCYFIIPDRFLVNKDYKALRNYLIKNTKLKEFIILGDGVFENVNMPTQVFGFNKEITQTEYLIKVKKSFYEHANFVNTNIILKNTDYNFNLFNNDESLLVVEKINNKSFKSEKYFDDIRGVEIGKSSSHITNNKILHSVPLLVGENIGRYYSKSSKYLKLNIPEIRYKDTLWYTSPKILFRKTGIGINATLDKTNDYCNQVIFILKIKKEYLQKLSYEFSISFFNSKLLVFWYYKNLGQEDRVTFPHITQGKIKQLPFIDFESIHQQPFITLVNQILENKKQGQNTSALEHQIDIMIYHLYGLTYQEACVIDKELKEVDFEKYSIITQEDETEEDEIRAEAIRRASVRRLLDKK
jgi:adenine-specific DNA-methyltransferase